MQVASEFHQKWNYPCCIGSLDGKHIAMQQPAESGTEFFNYKHFFSIILMALVDANYKFIYIDVGASGRAGDAGVFAGSTLKQALDKNSLNLPPDETVQGMENKLPYHIVADDAFPLSTRLMKPYPQRNLDHTKRIFNYRLSRTRRVVENAFGIMANRFRVFLSPINLEPHKVTAIILAACCLHNFLIDNNKHTYISAANDFEDTEHVIVSGSWRNDPALSGLPSTSDRNPAETAKGQRNDIAEYFSSDHGSVPWQEYMITH